MSLYAKLWTDILGDPKLMRAARKGAKHLVILPWLFAFAKQAKDGGALTVNGEPAEPEDIADMIPGITPKQVTICLAELSELGVVEEDGRGAWVLTSWDSRSGDGKPSDAPERVRARVQKHRDKKSGNANEQDGGSALQGALRNATEIEIEQEGEKEKEQEKEIHSLSACAWDELIQKFTNSADRARVQTFLERCPAGQRDAWVGRLGMWVRGEDLPPGMKPTQSAIAAALWDYAEKPGDWSGIHVQEYILRRARLERGAATLTAGHHRPQGPGGRSDAKGDGMLVFGELVAAVREVDVYVADASMESGRRLSGKRRGLPDEVKQALTKPTVRALRAIGGERAIVQASDDPAKRSYIASQFSGAYASAMAADDGTKEAVA